MHKYSRLVLLLLAMHFAPAFAGDINKRTDDVFGNGFYPGYMCVECRNPEDFPMDYAAFAYNHFFGENPWLRNSRLGIPFRVYNMKLEYAIVWFEKMLFDAPSFLPNLLEIKLRLENGRVLTMEVLQTGPPLPIGPEVNISRQGGGWGSGGDDDHDYSDDGEDFDFDDEGFRGVVEIEDPDDEGNFPEWEEEV